VIVRLAGEQDGPGFLDLAGQVEQWFGPMVDDPGFRAALDRHIRRATALVAIAADEAGLLGGLLFGVRPRLITCAGWWFPSEYAGRASAAPSWPRRCAGS
jgi:hypothetical protein